MDKQLDLFEEAQRKKEIDIIEEKERKNLMISFIFMKDNSSIKMLISIVIMFHQRLKDVINGLVLLIRLVEISSIGTWKRMKPI